MTTHMMGNQFFTYLCGEMHVPGMLSDWFTADPEYVTCEKCLEEMKQK